MAEQIVQQLGFDASGAIAGIDRLIGSLGRLNSALARTQSNLRKFGTGKAISNIGTFSRNVDTAAKNVNKLNTASNKLNNATNNVNKLNTASGGLLLSWQTLGRIAIAQGIVRGLNFLQAEFQEAIGLARDFNLAVAEAAAIAPGGVGQFTENVTALNKELIDTSRSFGFDVLDLAEAKYQEFSNQVRGSAESNRLFIASNKLARISASEVGESVGALSSVLNSYDLTVESADRVSAALFKTIELGRLRLSDIADQLGNVTPLARDAGIAFEEVFGALTTITRSGVSPSRSLTQIRALINQLQKPTAELQRLFENTFGVKNIEEAINQFGGLQGVIQAIADSAEGDSQRIAQFFTNIRARNAFLSLSGQAELLGENIREISDAANEGTTFLNELLAEFDAQDAVQFQKALNEFKLELLELAQDALPVVTDGIRLLTTGLQNFGETLSAGVVAGIAIYSTRLIFATGVTEAFALKTATARLGVLGLAFAVGFAAGEFIKFADTSAVAADIADNLKNIDDIETQNIADINAETAQTIENLQEIGRLGASSLAELTQTASRARDAIRQENDAFVSSTSASLDRLVRVRENFVRGLDSTIEGAEDRITKNFEDQSNIRQKISDFEFERRIRAYDELGQAVQRQRRAQDALNQALTNPRNEAGLENRLEALQRAEQLAQEAVREAQGTGNRAAVYSAEATLNQILQEQLRTKQLQAQLDQQQVAAAKARRDEEQASLDRLKENVQTLQQNLSLFSGGGELLPPAQRERAIREARDAFKAIQDEAFSRSDLDFGDLLGLTDLQLKFNDIVGGIDIDTTRQRFIRDLDEVAQDITVKIPVDLITNQASQLGLSPEIDPLRPEAGLGQLRGDVQAQLIEIEQVQQRLNTAAAAEDAIRSRIAERIQQIVRYNQENADTLPEQSARYQSILSSTGQLAEALGRVANNGRLSAEQIAQVENLLTQFDRSGFVTGADLPGLPLLGEEQVIRDIVAEYQRLFDLQAENVGNEGQLNRLNAERQQLLELTNLISQGVQSQNQLTQSVQTTAAGQDVYSSSIGVSIGRVQSLEQQYRGVNSQLSEAIRRQQELNSLQSQGSPVGRMFGGPLYRAFGGLARGTDIIPAMLSPGETVMNSNASRKFASQLNAMNAGVNPVYRQDGGPVTNNSVNIGDINVNGTSDPEETARLVATKLRREFRRGTASRF